MQALGAFLADAITTSPDGKFNVLGGGVELLSGPTYPLGPMNLAVFARLSVDDDEVGTTRRWKIVIEAPDDAGTVANIENAFTVNRSETTPELRPIMNLIFAFYGLKLDRPGMYTVIVSVEGQEIARLSLLARLIKTAE